jgi:DNA repair photolyase
MRGVDLNVKTKIVYEPVGRAREYCELAANLYRGCSHGCTYCYSPLAKRMKREEFAEPAIRPGLLEDLEKDARKLQGDAEMRKRNILLCFTCDPYQPIDDRCHVTRDALKILLGHGLNVTVLTKGGLRSARDFNLLAAHREQSTYAATFTLIDETDRKKYEPDTAPAAERMDALHKAHAYGIRRWASLEPVIRPEQTLELIRRMGGFVDLYDPYPDYLQR